MNNDVDAIFLIMPRICCSEQVAVYRTLGLHESEAPITFICTHHSAGVGYATVREGYISAITMAGLTFIFPFRLRSAAKERPTLSSFLTSPFLLRRT
jgi:hypothetical protein